MKAEFLVWAKEGYRIGDCDNKLTDFKDAVNLAIDFSNHNQEDSYVEVRIGDDSYRKVFSYNYKSLVNAQKQVEKINNI